MSGRRPGAFQIIEEVLDRNDPRGASSGAHGEDADAILNALYMGGFDVVERA